MRITCKIVGDTKSFHLEPVLETGYGWDTDETRLFAMSLCSSIYREMGKLSDMFESEFSEDLSYRKSIDSISRNVERDRFGYVYIDIYSDRIKGKPTPFCKISISNNDAGVRTINILPSIARFIYNTVWFLKKTTPPNGMECLKHINIIRNFNDPKSKTHELYIEDGTVKPESVKVRWNG